MGEAFQQGDHAGAVGDFPDDGRCARRGARAGAHQPGSRWTGSLPAMKKGAKTFAEAGGEDAYFGDPTAASAEDGDAYFEALAEVLSLSVMEHLGSKA